MSFSRDRGSRRGWLLGPLGWRLFAAFTVVALGAVGLLAVVAAASVRQQTSGLVDAQRAQVRRDILDALSAAYARAGSWPKANLAGVQALARSNGASLVVLDTTGGPVAAVSPGHDWMGDWQQTSPGSSDTHPDHGSTITPQPSWRSGWPDDSWDTGTHDDRITAGQQPLAVAAVTSAPAAAVRAVAGGAVADAAPTAPPTGTKGLPVVVNGRAVGTVLVDFLAATNPPTAQASAAILRTLWVSAMIAVALAAGAALIVSRRITRPIVALAAATDAVERGRPDAPDLIRAGPGELGQLSRAFTRMAGTLRRQDQLRRAVVADVAHELRTPVTILRGMTEEMLDGLADPTPTRITSLHDEVLRLERIVDDLATLSSAEAAGLRLERGRVDLATITSQAVQLLEPQLDDAKLDTRVDLDPVEVNGDPQRLAQVVINLLTNAIKYTPDGGQVAVGVHPQDGRAVLTVADTGPGILPAELPHVFERFWRGTSSSGRSGTGIGLAVAAELVAAHDGTIAAASPPGTGATFTITLPAA